MKSAYTIEKEIWGEQIEHFVRYKSFDFWRFYDRYYIEFHESESGYYHRELTKEQAEKLNGELAQFDNPLTAAEYIIKKVLSGTYN